MTIAYTQEELQEFFKEATETFAEAQLYLRLGELTIRDPTYEEKHISSVLGIIWNRDDDERKEDQKKEGKILWKTIEEMGWEILNGNK